MAHALINNTSRQRYHLNSVDQPEISAAIFRFIEFIQICGNCCTIPKLAKFRIGGGGIKWPQEILKSHCVNSCFSRIISGGSLRLITRWLRCLCKSDQYFIHILYCSTVFAGRRVCGVTRQRES